jgi:hypothetical protein
LVSAKLNESIWKKRERQNLPWTVDTKNRKKFDGGKIKLVQNFVISLHFMNSLEMHLLDS